MFRVEIHPGKRHLTLLTAWLMTAAAWLSPLSTTRAGDGAPQYVFLTPVQWAQAQSMTTWAIPRASLSGDTLCVKPLDDCLSDSLRDALVAAGSDTTEFLDLDCARQRTAGTLWQEVEE